MNVIEELMEAVGNAVEAGERAEDMQWSLSAERHAELKAAVTPSLDPFFQDDTLLGLPYIVKGNQVEPFILQNERVRPSAKPRRYNTQLILTDEDKAQIRAEADYRRTGR